MKLYMTAQEVLGLDWKKNPHGLRGRGGIYRIVERSTGKLLYVGQSDDVGHRLCPSCHHVYNKKIHDVYILFEGSADERAQMEGVFIQLLKPSKNRRNGTMPEPSQEQLRECYDRIFNRS